MSRETKACACSPSCRYESNAVCGLLAQSWAPGSVGCNRCKNPLRACTACWYVSVASVWAVWHWATSCACNTGARPCVAANPHNTPTVRATVRMAAVRMARCLARRRRSCLTYWRRARRMTVSNDGVYGPGAFTAPAFPRPDCQGTVPSGRSQPTAHTRCGIVRRSGHRRSESCRRALRRDRPKRGTSYHGSA